MEKNKPKKKTTRVKTYTRKKKGGGIIRIKASTRKVGKTKTNKATVKKVKDPSGNLVFTSETKK